ncbi:hypothetical protein FKM82_001116 [Ascaphus truei]
MMAEQGLNLPRDVTGESESKAKEEGDSSTNKTITKTDEQYRYTMNKPVKSLCLILNMELFDDSQSNPKLEQRTGTDIDVKSLEKTFKAMGFQVQIENNKKCSEINDILEAAAKEDHSQRSCFVCLVMSHGNEKEEIHAFDTTFRVDWLIHFFKGENCKSLLLKPKLFFFQACRGDKKDSGVKVDSGSDDHIAKIPIEADFLYVYSTPPGYCSWRNAKNGSWFIQSLCEMLQQHWKTLELMQILTRVNHKIAYKYEDIKDKNKQISCIVSMLTKELHLANELSLTGFNP